MAEVRRQERGGFLRPAESDVCCLYLSLSPSLPELHDGGRRTTKRFLSISFFPSISFSVASWLPLSLSHFPLGGQCSLSASSSSSHANLGSPCPNFTSANLEAAAAVHFLLLLRGVTKGKPKPCPTTGRAKSGQGGKSFDKQTSKLIETLGE